MPRRSSDSQAAQQRYRRCRADQQDRAYVKPILQGEDMRASGVGKILASKSSKWKEGQQVYGYFGWADYAVVPEAAVVMQTM